jgi:hypothetical protein
VVKVLVGSTGWGDDLGILSWCKAQSKLSKAR